MRSLFLFSLLSFRYVISTNNNHDLKQRIPKSQSKELKFEQKAIQNVMYISRRNNRYYRKRCLIFKVLATFSSTAASPPKLSGFLPARDVNLMKAFAGYLSNLGRLTECVS